MEFEAASDIPFYFLVGHIEVTRDIRPIIYTAIFRIYLLLNIHKSITKHLYTEFTQMCITSLEMRIQILQQKHFFI
jgi:hypothetical protein